MQINSIQTAEPSFGTKIKADLEVLRDCKYYGGYYIFENLVKQLENNGRNDVFVMSTAQKSGQINALTYEIKPSKNGYGKYLISKVQTFEIWNEVPGRRNLRRQNLVEIYNKCYKNMMENVPKKVNKLGDWTKYLI